MFGNITTIDTQHKLEKHLKESNCFEEAEKVNIDFNGENIKFTLFPVAHKIVKFLELPNVLENIIENQRVLRETSQNNDNTLYNIVNTGLWATVLNDFNDDDIVIPLILYNDDFNPDNGLGPQKANTELTSFYVSLPTLNEHLVSSTDNIFITMMGNAKQLKLHTDIILLRIVDQLRVLENGVYVGTNTGPKQVFVITVLIVGDNVAQNMIQGFPRSLNANGFCRTCTMNRNRWLLTTRENVELLRNEDNYIAGQNGIRQISLFNELRYTILYSFRNHFLFVQLFFTDITKCSITKQLITYMIGS